MVPYMTTPEVTNVEVTHQPLSPSVGGGWSGLYFAELCLLQGNFQKVASSLVERREYNDTR